MTGSGLKRRMRAKEKLFLFSKEILSTRYLKGTFKCLSEEVPLTVL